MFFVFSQITRQNQNDPTLIHLSTAFSRKSEVLLPLEIYHHKNTQWKQSMVKCLGVTFFLRDFLGDKSEPLPWIFQHGGEQNRT